MFQPIDEFFLKESIPLVGLRASTWDDLAEDYVDELTQATSRLLKNAVWRRIFSMCAAATTGEMGGDPRGMRGNRYDIASYLILQTDSSRCGQKLRNANAVVSGCRQHEEPFNQRQRRSRKSEQGDKWSFCLTAGTLWPANQERP